jgi:hypothetical protein
VGTILSLGLVLALWEDLQGYYAAMDGDTIFPLTFTHLICLSWQRVRLMGIPLFSFVPKIPRQTITGRYERTRFEMLDIHAPQAGATLLST